LSGLILAGFLAGLVVTYYYSQVLALGYKINRLEKELALLRVENHDLDEEIRRLASLERVEYLAVNKLGMVKPDSSNILVVAVAGKALPVSGPELKTGTNNGSLPGKDKNHLIRAFSELVNRLENRLKPGQNAEARSGEGTDAYHQYPDPQKNNRAVSNYHTGACWPDFPPGLAATG